MNYSLYNFIGNPGVFLIIFSYLLLQLKKIDSSGIPYSLINLFGALFVIILLIENFNMSAFVLEVFWVAISFVGVYNFFKNNHLSESK